MAIATFGGLAGTVMGVGFGSLFAGTTIFQLLISGLPFIGWLIALIATLIGIGAIWLLYRDGDVVDVVDKGKVAVVDVVDKREVAVGV